MVAHETKDKLNTGKTKGISNIVNRSKFWVTDPIVRKVSPFCNRLGNAGKSVVFLRKRGSK